MSSKRGLAYNDAKIANRFHEKSSYSSWAYNWGWKDDGLSLDVEFVPMLWNETFAPSLKNNIDVLRKRGLKYILSFNEPDLISQANMAVDRAVASHVNLLNQYSSFASIGSPAVSSNESPPAVSCSLATAPISTSGQTRPQSLQWLREFLELCDKKGCAVNFCAVHWYGKASEADNLICFLYRARDTCRGKPIWLTEFQATGSEAEVVAFMRQILPFLDKADFIQRYAWFMVETGNLMQSTDTLSTYGSIYASLPT